MKTNLKRCWRRLSNWFTFTHQKSRPPVLRTTPSHHPTRDSNQSKALARVRRPHPELSETRPSTGQSHHRRPVGLRSNRLGSLGVPRRPTPVPGESGDAPGRRLSPPVPDSVTMVEQGKVVLFTGERGARHISINRDNEEDCRSRGSRVGIPYVGTAESLDQNPQSLQNAPRSVVNALRTYSSSGVNKNILDEKLLSKSEQSLDCYLAISGLRKHRPPKNVLQLERWMTICHSVNWNLWIQFIGETSNRRVEVMALWMLIQVDQKEGSESL